MSNISEVVVIDVSGVIEHRGTKHCVCVSVSAEKYLLINTNHRDIYDDFEIKSSEYAFLKPKNRFVCCSEMYHFDSDEIIKSVGTLNRNDMIKIVDKIQNSESLKKAEKDFVILELGKWLSKNP
ncbi:MAG: hypothetical protein LBC59_09530 [Chitinispirillales bacterium]|nr:hypothetical protein [Chitinispirillales bacterium]